MSKVQKPKLKLKKKKKLRKFKPQSSRLHKAGIPLHMLLKPMRQKMRLKQNRMAEIVGVNASHLCEVERGTSNLSIPALQRYLNTCGYELSVRKLKNHNGYVTPEQRIVKVDKDSVGELLRDLRKGQRYTQQKVADLTGFSRIHLCGIERNKHLPSYKNFQILLFELGYEPTVRSIKQFNRRKVPYPAEA